MIANRALVTGGNGRIGAAISKGLLSAGFEVIVHTSGPDAVFDEDLHRHVVRAKACHQICADLTDEEATRALVPDVVRRHGPLSLLVNNASIFELDEPGGDQSIWNDHFAIHLRAPSLLIAAFAGQLPVQQDRLVINMVDQRVLKPNPNFHSYTLSKAALWTATRTLAQAYAPHIRVNAIGPGPTLPSTRQSEQDFQQQLEALPLKQGTTPDEIAHAVLFLWSMPSITGQLLALDGGQHLAWETADLMIAE